MASVLVASFFLKADIRNQCKHLLAARLAQQMDRCVERMISPDDLVAIISHQFS
jgi:hypothetical protein